MCVAMAAIFLHPLCSLATGVILELILLLWSLSVVFKALCMGNQHHTWQTSVRERCKRPEHTVH